MNFLIIGVTGQLGSALIKDAYALGYNVLAPTEVELDITKPQLFLKYLKEFSPDVVINTAAFHNLPLCEENPAMAFKVNCFAVKDMAAICEESDIWFMSFSTDYVFDGKKREPYIESDPPGPLQVYGLSKLAGEYAALSYSKSIIIRTCGLYGLQGAETKGGNFVDKRIKDSESLSRLEMGNDQMVSPTYTIDLSKAVLDIIVHPKIEKGIFHLVNEGSCTWYEFTKEIYRIMNIDIQLVPVDRKGRSSTFRRPLYSVLKNERARKLGIRLPFWKDAIRRYINTKYMNEVE